MDGQNLTKANGWMEFHQKMTPNVPMDGINPHATGATPQTLAQLPGHLTPQQVKDQLAAIAAVNNGRTL